jgi:hypothetical protein
MSAPLPPPGEIASRRSWIVNFALRSAKPRLLLAPFKVGMWVILSLELGQFSFEKVTDIRALPPHIKGQDPFSHTMRFARRAKQGEFKRVAFDLICTGSL